MSRPSGRDESVIREAALSSVGDLRQWLAEDSQRYSDDELIGHLLEAVRYEHDGYGRAKHLEHHGYSPDSALVELLDNVDVWSAERRAVARWVKEFDVKPPFPIGTAVSFEDTTGEITKHDESHGLATVFVESRGHVREGIGTHGYLVAWEKLKPLTTSAEMVGRAPVESRSGDEV